MLLAFGTWYWFFTKAGKRKKKYGVGRDDSDSWVDKLRANKLSQVMLFQKPLVKDLKVKLVDLLIATNGFRADNVINSTRIRTTYNVVLSDGSALAIKWLNACKMSEKHFRDEMHILGQLRHPNLVPLLGFCVVEEEKLLVYKHLPNGTLYSFLNGKMESVIRNCFIMCSKEFEKARNDRDDVFLCEYKYDIHWHSFKRISESEDNVVDDDEAENDGDWISCEDTDSDVKDNEEYERENQSNLLTRPSSAHPLAAVYNLSFDKFIVRFFMLPKADAFLDYKRFIEGAMFDDQCQITLLLRGSHWMQGPFAEPICNFNFQTNTVRLQEGTTLENDKHTFEQEINEYSSKSTQNRLKSVQINDSSGLKGQEAMPNEADRTIEDARPHLPNSIKNDRSAPNNFEDKTIKGTQQLAGAKRTGDSADISATSASPSRKRSETSFSAPVVQENNDQRNVQNVLKNSHGRTSQEPQILFSIHNVDVAFPESSITQYLK